jgi:hypothetical protein
MITEKYLDGLNQPELKDLYFELWLNKNTKEAEIVYNYIEENYPYMLEENLLGGK